MPPSSSPHLRGSQPDRTGHRPPAPIMVAPNTGPCPGHNPSPHHRSFLFLGWSSVTEGALHTRQDRGKVGSSSCGGEGIGTKTGGLLARQRRPGLSRSQGKLSVRAALGMATRWVYSAEIQVLGHLSVPMLGEGETGDSESSGKGQRDQEKAGKVGEDDQTRWGSCWGHQESRCLGKVDRGGRI